VVGDGVEELVYEGGVQDHVCEEVLHPSQSPGDLEKVPFVANQEVLSVVLDGLWIVGKALRLQWVRKSVLVQGWLLQEAVHRTSPLPLAVQPPGIPDDAPSVAPKTRLDFLF